MRGICEEYTPSTRDTYPFPNPYPHVNTVKMSELIITPSAYNINGDSPMTRASESRSVTVANTVAMTTFAVSFYLPVTQFPCPAYSAISALVCRHVGYLWG